MIAASSDNSDGPHDPQPKPVAAGKGKVLTVDASNPRDLELIRRAQKERWPISRKTRRMILAQMETLIENGSEDMVEAARLIIAADRLNIAEQEASKPASTHIHGDNVQVVFVDDWYGSKAANTTAANGTPAKGVIEP